MKKRYENPPILAGYKHVEGKWNNGFVIERITDGSQFVWVPVGILDADGTLDGKNFTEKFGRRNYLKDRFSDTEYNEFLEGELLEQLESVKKYEGYYISCHIISKSSEGKPQSVLTDKCWTDINFVDAQKIAATFENCEAVKSHLTYGAEYDSMLAWFIKSGAQTQAEVVGKPSKMDYNNINRIYNFGASINCDEWTQEKNARFSRTIRGTSCYSDKGYSMAKRDYFYTTSSFHETGFRIVLCIK